MNQIETGLGTQAQRTRPVPPASILVATDLSARSDRAVARAKALATMHGASLTVLHVIDADLPEQARTSLAQTAELAIAADLGGTKATVDIREGEDFRTILKAAAEHGADLIVMGRHRNEDGAKPLGGTTLDRVVRHAPCPVLLAAGPVHAPYGRIIAALDLSAASGSALCRAASLAPAAEVHGVHGYEVAFAGFQHDPGSLDAERDVHADQIAAQIATLPNAVEVTPCLIAGHAEAALRTAVKDLSPDLIALGTHARTGLARAIIGSVAEGFLEHPPCDVLVTTAPRP